MGLSLRKLLGCGGKWLATWKRTDGLLHSIRSSRSPSTDTASTAELVLSSEGDNLLIQCFLAMLVAATKMASEKSGAFRLKKKKSISDITRSFMLKPRDINQNKEMKNSLQNMLMIKSLDNYRASVLAKPQRLNMLIGLKLLAVTVSHMRRWFPA